MAPSTVLLCCCVLLGWLQSAAALGEPCTFDAAGTGGDCRPISHCPTLLRIARNAKPGTSVLARLRELVGKCPRSAGQLQICCQNELTRRRLPTPTPTPTPTPKPTPTSLPSKDVCGVSFDGGRVISGENVTIGEFPWMASIQYSTAPGRPLEHGCGGTLITSRHVLTAAHCVTFLSTPQMPDLAPKAVVLGEVDFSGERDCMIEAPEVCADPPVTVEIDAIFPHPDFQSIVELALPNDIAVVRLAREVPFTDFIRPVCLLTDLSVLRGRTDISPERLGGAVAGWGRTEIGGEDNFTPVLQKATVPVRNISECEAQFRVTGIGLAGRICAGAGDGGADTCRGDSGGPLLVPVERGVRWYQTGVSSFGTEECGQVAGYTRVFDYKDWIVEQLNRP